MLEKKELGEIMRK